MKNKTLRILALAALMIAALSSCRYTSKTTEQNAQVTDVQLSEDLLPQNTNSLVTDLAHILKKDDINDINEKLIELDSLNLAQVAVVTVKDLGGMDALDYATALANKWGVGHKGANDGIVILVKPKIDATPKGKGKATIATGLGMEEILTNDMCKRIIDEEMVPKFKENKYGEAIKDAINEIKDFLEDKAINIKKAA